MEYPKHSVEYSKHSVFLDYGAGGGGRHVTCRFDVRVTAYCVDGAAARARVRGGFSIAYTYWNGVRVGGFLCYRHTVVYMTRLFFKSGFDSNVIPHTHTQKEKKT